MDANNVLQVTLNLPACPEDLKAAAKALQAKEAGMLIVPFDISVNGEVDIPPEKAEQLLEILYLHFPSRKKVAYANLKEQVYERDIVTTRFIRESKLGLLPWKYPLPTAVAPLLKLRLPKALFLDLTFFCHVFEC